MKVWAYLALAALLIGAAAGYTKWVYDQGWDANQAEHDRELREATTGVLTTATTNNILDATLGVETSEAVDDVRERAADRAKRTKAADLTPPPTGGPDASVCPDVLGPAFWRVYDDAAGGDPATAPATGPATGVPGGDPRPDPGAHAAGD